MQGNATSRVFGILLTAMIIVGLSVAAGLRLPPSDTVDFTPTATVGR